MKLVIFKDNWADEMDLSGFNIWSDEEWKEFLNSDYFPDEVCIGSNEEIVYESLEDWKRKFQARSIDENEETILRKLFEKLPLGTFPHTSYFKKSEED